jgi:hypothetical protein
MKSRMNWMLYLWLRVNGWRRVSKPPALLIWRKRVEPSLTMEVLTGAAVTYELQLASITSSKASTSAARRAFRGESKAGRELLRRIGLVALPGLRYSQAKGVLVLVGHRAFGARAHTALTRSHS